MSSGHRAFLSASYSPSSSLPDRPDDDKDDSERHVLHAHPIDAVAGADQNHNALSQHQHIHSALKLSSPPTTSGLTCESSTTSSASPATSTPQRPGSQVQFRTHTTAPSPPPSGISESPSTPTLQTPSEISTDRTPSAALRLQTDFHLVKPTIIDSSHSFTTPSRRPKLNLHHKTSASSLRPVSRTPSLKTVGFGNPFGSASAASSTVTSPVIAAMGDVTPLPSPLLSSDSPGPWKKLGSRTSREAMSSLSSPTRSNMTADAREPTAASTGTPSKKKTYASLAFGPGPANSLTASGQDGQSSQPLSHTRNRSISEYIPDPMLIPKRMTTVSGTHVKADLKNLDGHMRREPHLSEARGLTPIEKPPTPPPSESSLSANDSSSVNGSGFSTSNSKKPRHEYFEAYDRRDKKRRRWRAIKMLGQGTFSRVMLATSQSSSDDEESALGNTGLQTPEPQSRYHRRTLVAVKVCEHGPRGGASEDRIEMSLKRELEIMQCIHHPSLVHLKAWNIEPTRAILVLSYCPGGDLFDVASGHRELLSPALLRRIFAELVGAVRYLHEMKIVHRDIKLENVLVNLPPEELRATTTDWTTYPHSVITLTDLGLSRRIADDEKLETRCGSDDYAAPEVIMGQPYDGRATDAWSLGVLLYALLESRLPFDPHPNIGDYAMQMRMRSRTSHRIARVEWRWIEYGAKDGDDGEGDHEADIAQFENKNLRGAMEVVEGLLKRARTRWPLAKVAETDWVGGGIRVEGGIRFREEEEGEEVL